MKKLGLSLSMLFLLTSIAVAQFHVPSKTIVKTAPKWAQLMYSDNPNVLEVKREFRAYYKGKVVPKNIHTRNLKFFKRSVQYRTKKDGSVVSKSNKTYQSRLTKKNTNRNAKNPSGNWSLLGPVQSLTEEGDPGGDQACVYSIDQSLSNPDILFCGTEPGEVYKSTDGGNNWTNMSLNLVLPFDEGMISAIAIHPTNPNMVYFGMQDNVYRSEDGGVSWDVVHRLADVRDEDIIEEIFIHPTRPDIIMLATTEGLVQSTNGGVSWNVVFEDRTYDIEMNTAEDNIIYVLRKNEERELPEFLISTNYGASFSVQTNGWYTSSNSNRESDGGRIAVTEADPNRVYAYLIGQSKPVDFGYIGVFRSDDGGNSWTLPIGRLGGPYNSNHFNITSFDGEGENDDNGIADISFCALVASNENPDHILLGGFNLWKSEDGGETFEAQGGYLDGPLNNAAHSGSFHVDMQEFKAFGNTTWITTDGGIYKSGDFFSTTNGFEKKNRGVHSTDFWGFGSGWNEDILIGGVFHNGVLAYNERFGAGNYIVLGGGEPSSGYVNPGDNNLVYSTDIGAVSLPDAIAPVEELEYDFVPNESYDPLDEGYSDLAFHPQCYSVAFTGQLNELWRTTDKGESFQRLRTFGNNEEDWITYIHISRSNPDLMYMCQRDEGNGRAKLWKSSDAGADWTEIAVPSNVSEFMILQADPYDPSKLWIASSDFDNPTVIYQSDNGGATWKDLVKPILDDEYMKTLDYIPGTNGGLYLGTNLGMYYKNEDMTDWMDFSEGLPAVSTAQKSRPFYRDNKLRISSTKGMWESELFERPARPFAQIMVDRIETCTEIGSNFTFVDYSILQHLGATWEWTFEGGTPATASTWEANVTFNEVGTHKVTLKITDDRGFTDSDVLEINIGGAEPSINILFDQETCETTSISNPLDNTNALMISPNPSSSGIFRIEYKSLAEDRPILRIFDMSGKTLFKEQLPAQINGLIKHRINLDELPKGTYWMQIKGTDEIRSGKVVIL